MIKKTFSILAIFLAAASISLCAILPSECLAGPKKKIMILPLVNKTNSDIAAVAFIYRRANYREYIEAVQKALDAQIKQSFPAAAFEIIDSSKAASIIEKQGYDLAALDMPDKETLKSITEGSQVDEVIAIEASNLGTCIVPYHTGSSPWFLSCLIRSYNSSTKKYSTFYFNNTDTFSFGERGGDINGAITRIATQTFDQAFKKINH